MECFMYAEKKPVLAPGQYTYRVRLHAMYKDEQTIYGSFGMFAFSFDAPFQLDVNGFDIKPTSLQIELKDAKHLW